MRTAILALALVLVGCTRAAEQAEEDYKFALTSGTMDQTCAAAKRARDAWFERRNPNKIKTWDFNAKASCGHADSLRRQGL